VASLVKTSEANNITSYELTRTALSTKYGIISEKYADADKYPFVIFDANGNCLSASSVYAKDNGGGIRFCIP
jgi:hypothetical protein